MFRDLNESCRKDPKKWEKFKRKTRRNCFINRELSTRNKSNHKFMHIINGIVNNIVGYAIP